MLLIRVRKMTVAVRSAAFLLGDSRQLAMSLQQEVCTRDASEDRELCATSLRSQ